jgi:uncharacterized protein YcbK (DUF882 family)
MSQGVTTIRDFPPPMLTQNFGFDEFAQKAGHGLPEALYPLDWVDERLLPLCEVLEELRHALGDRPMKVISGYRSREYNTAIGGASRSQHVEGRAADIQVPGVSPTDVHAAALQLHKEGRIRLGGLGLYPTFVHVDIRPGGDLKHWTG